MSEAEIAQMDAAARPDPSAQARAAGAATDVFSRAAAFNEQPSTPWMDRPGVAQTLLRGAGSLVRGVVKPIAQAPIQAAKGLVGNVAALAGNEELAAKALAPSNVPFLGEVKVPSAVPTDAARYGTQTARESAAQGLEIAASAIPAGTAGKTGWQAVKGAAVAGAESGALAGAASGIKKEDATLKSVAKDAAVGALVGGTVSGGITGAAEAASGIRGALMPEAKQALTSAIKPGKNNVRFSKDVDKAVEILSDDAPKISSLADLDAAIRAKKASIWGQVQEKLAKEGEDYSVDLGRAAKDGLKSAADELDDLAARRTTELLEPGAAENLKELAGQLRSQRFTPAEAEDTLEALNAQLKSYYAKNATTQAAAEKASPVIAGRLKVAQALREQLDAKLEGFGALKSDYGALANVGNEVAGRLNVVNRANMTSLPEQIGVVSNAGPLMRSILTLDPRGALEAGLNLASGKVLKHLESADAKVAYAFGQGLRSAARAVPGTVTDAAKAAGRLTTKALRLKAAKTATE